ncbi:MAG: hypothetical protein JST26_09865 [Bacteroidetes bacterium]|nr:hypothetical protein [Bacteroidota bacterium]
MNLPGKRIILLWLLLSFQSTFSQSDFKDVASVFYNRCSSCHNDYSHGTPLLNYSQVYANRAAIASYLSTGYMPRWLPDTTYSRFAHEQTISVQEKNEILSWINTGAQKGDTTLAPPAPQYSQNVLHGTPDLELKIPNFVINAYTTDAHDCFSIPSGLLQDRIIRAFEIVPGNVSAVHHVIVALDSAGTTGSNLSGNCSSLSGSYSIGGATTAGFPTVFPGNGPLKAGMPVKAGSNVVLDIHYEAGTGGQTDSTKIRFFFYPMGTTGIRRVQSLCVNYHGFNLPPNQVSQENAYYPPTGGGLPQQITVFSIFPHSHKLCTSVKDYAFSGADTVPLIRINNWDFDWQGWYTYPRPLIVPAGFNIVAQHIYDNTTANPNNPNNPPIQVNSGKNDNDEMLLDILQWLPYQSGDEHINVDSILEADPLVTGINDAQVNSVVKEFELMEPFPNPSTADVTFRFYNKSAGALRLQIYNIHGELIRSFSTSDLASGGNEMVWDGKDESGISVAAGTYSYTMFTSHSIVNGKLVLLPSKTN